MTFQPQTYAEALEKAKSRPAKPRSPLRRRSDKAIRAQVGVGTTFPQKTRERLDRSLKSIPRRVAKKKKTKRAKLPSIKSLHKRAWEQFSIWVRTENADSEGYVQCVTCPSRHLWNSGLIHAGHWIHGRLDFDPRNIAPQCRNDNFFTNTRVNTAYSCFMAKTYGAEIMDELRLLSNTKLNKYTRDELNDLIAHYKQINSNHPLLQEVK